MSLLVACALAAASAAVLVAVPSPGAVRLASLRAPVRRPLPLAPVLVAAAGLVAVVLGPVPALLGLLAGGVVLRVGRSRGRRRRAAAERAGALEACAALTGELRAGRDPADALAAAAEVAAGGFGRALSSAAAAARLGGDVPAALVEDAAEVAHVQRALAACWTVCATSGSGLASAVERLEEGLRGEQVQRRAVEAELAGPRATAFLLAVLPVFGLLLAGGLGADPLHVLLETPLGLVCLCAGLGLDALGVLWTDRLVRRAGGTA